MGTRSRKTHAGKFNLVAETRSGKSTRSRKEQGAGRSSARRNKE
jgi:hypothetical protein